MIGTTSGTGSGHASGAPGFTFGFLISGISILCCVFALFFFFKFTIVLSAHFFKVK